jgi:hypothetical protein
MERFNPKKLKRQRVKSNRVEVSNRFEDFDAEVEINSACEII